MTDEPTQTLSLLLDPATHTTLLHTVCSLVPHIPNAPEAITIAKREAALAFITKLRPRDPLELMFAVQILAANLASVETHARAAQPGLLPALALRYLAKSASFTRLAASTLRELKRYRDYATVSASIPAPRAQPAPAVAASAQPAPAATASAPMRQPDPAPRPEAPADAQSPATTAQPPATATPTCPETGTAGSPTEATIDQFLAEINARAAAAVALAA
jgi:hypothetical protein